MASRTGRGGGLRGPPHRVPRRTDGRRRPVRDNPDSLGISGDFPAAATAAWAVLAPHPRGGSPAQTSWYAHHGSFSSYDPTGPETLTKARWVADLAYALIASGWVYTAFVRDLYSRMIFRMSWPGIRLCGTTAG